MSVYGDILTAVRSVVKGLALEYLPQTSIVVRKAPVYLAEHDPVPLLVISPVLDGLAGLQFSDGAHLTYEVRLTIYNEVAYDWENLTWLLDAREQIRQALYVTTLSGTPVYDVAWQPNPVYDAGVVPAGVDVSRTSFVYTTSEERTG